MQPLPMWLEYGRHPWDPCIWVSKTEDWMTNDVPVIGRFLIGSTWFLFCCDGEAHAGKTSWWYTVCDEPPDVFDSQEHMIEWLDNEFETARKVWKVAVENFLVCELEVKVDEVDE